MDDQRVYPRLTSIPTQWTAVLRAHQDPGEEAAEAQRELLLRYYGAVYRYLLGLLRDPGVAEDLTQDFAVRFMRGDFRRADPERGRFRDFLKTALRHLAMDHWRRQAKTLARMPAEAAGQFAAPSSEEDLDREFWTRWREELLAQAWHALAQAERAMGQPFHTALAYKAKHAGATSQQLADHLHAATGKPFTSENARQVLHRARKRFAELLVEEVARSLETTTPEDLEQELIDLDLLAYCRSALRSRGKPK